VARYVIRGGKAGADRLLVLARAWAATTAALLERVGVAPGARCLDLGCGPGDVTLLLAQIVGPEGRVIGVDMDEEKLAIAAERARGAGLGNVELRAVDLYALPTDEHYDLVYSRNVLQHLPEPVEMLRRMWRLTAEGGALVAEDADFGGSFCHPPDPGFDFWVERYQKVLGAFGGDPTSGRRLAERFVAAGIPAPEVTVVQRADLTGEAKILPWLTVDATADAMREVGVATEQEIRAALDHLRVIADDDTTLVGSPRVFQAWARRS
jgi:ubiquinone/menaquinone biosynthesis C-methylase UbiE